MQMRLWKRALLGSTLAVAGGRVFAGNAADKFVPAQPFKFLPAKVD